MTTIRRLVEAGVLKKEQVAPWAPWEIRRGDLDSEPVREILQRLRQTGKLSLAGDDSRIQLTLFEEGGAFSPSGDNDREGARPDRDPPDPAQ